MEQNKQALPHDHNERRAAIYDDGNIIVSAGAGSGKTTVMIARIIEKLKKGVPIEQMLIVTFTRASAADMRRKLTEKLYELGVDEQLSGVVSAALEALPSANMGTLHSYCQRLIRMYFYAAGLDPSAAVCDEGEADAIKKRAVTEAVDAAWNGGDLHFMTMYDMLCTRRSDDAVIDTVVGILEFALTMPDPIAYLNDSRPDSAYFADLDRAVDVRRNRLLRRRDELRLMLDEIGLKAQARSLDETEDFLDGRIDKFSSAAYYPSRDPAPISVVGQKTELNADFKAFKDECRKFLQLKGEATAAKQQESYLYSLALRKVAEDAYHRYVDRKKALGKIDYSDLEHGAYKVLCDEDCLREIADNIKYVFIDEFQDVNPLQSAIAEKLRLAGAEMFVVGDIKQSIYGFRRCSPEHFKNAIQSNKYKRISLTENFRSSKEVIDFVNGVFSGVMTEDIGGVDYSDGTQKLVWGNKSIDSGDAVYYAVGDTDAASPEKPEGKRIGYSVVNAAAADEVNLQAELVADCIVKYVKNKLEQKDVKDTIAPLTATPEERASAPVINDYELKIKKIAVLVRSVKTQFCTALCKELDKRDVPYCIERKNKAKTFPEVVALMDILRCADNRLDDVALYTAMRSSMGGFGDAELLEIAAVGDKNCRAAQILPLNDDKYAFWQKVKAYDGALKQKVDAFLSARDSVIEYAQNHDCADVLGYITSRIDYFQHVYEQKQSAEVVDSLIRFAAERECDMHAFLSYYDNSDIELTSSGGGDAVVITTMHASKGLEYDLAIVANTDVCFSDNDKDRRVITSENGVFVRIPDSSRRLLKTAPWMAENLAYLDRLRSEEMRLFYVALTRAKYKLIVCGDNKAFMPSKEELKAGKTKKAVSADTSSCMMHFLAHLTPSANDVEHMEIGDGPKDYPLDADVAAAVADRHRQAEDYNAERMKNALPVKTCVTAVAHAEWEGDYTETAKVLIDDERNTGDGDSLLRGTAYHRAMEKVDFASPDMDMLRSDCENFNLVDERQIIRAAEVMHELTKDSLFTAKERYFIVSLPAGLVYKDKTEGELLVQGVIDLLIVNKDNTAIIVDYKTGDPGSLKNEAYRKQLMLYTEAVERTTPYKVKKAVLYSFLSGELIEP